MTLIPAKTKDQDFLDEIERFKSDQSCFHLWWLGQSGYLLQWNNKRILIDPYLSDSLTKKYAETKKPHVRMSERVIAPELLKNIDIVSSSHNHTDHLDGDTLVPVLQNNPATKFIIPEANRAFVAERVKCSMEFPIGLNDGKSVRLVEFTYLGIPAKHNDIERDENGNCKFMGYVIEFGSWKIYHSGDTLLFDELPLLLKPFGIDIAILPINGNDPSRGVAGNLNSREAAELGKAIGARLVIPCHYDMFTFNTADVNEFGGISTGIGQSYAILRGGERLQFK